MIMSVCLGSCFLQRAVQDFFKACGNTESHCIGVTEDCLIGLKGNYHIYIHTHKISLVPYMYGAQYFIII